VDAAIAFADLPCNYWGGLGGSHPFSSCANMHFAAFAEIINQAHAHVVLWNTAVAILCFYFFYRQVIYTKASAPRMDS
jgi:hypothetical protein